MRPEPRPKTLTVALEEIGADGLVLDRILDQPQVDATLTDGGRSQEPGFRAAGDAALHARLTKLSRGVVLEGRVTAPITGVCKRCLVDVSLEVPVTFTLNLVSRKVLEDLPMTGEGEDDADASVAGTLDFTDVNEELFEGETIDLDPIVREQLLLALPISVLCRDECKGLCPVCGQDLNEQPCSCPKKTLDPRLAALKDIKLS